MRIVRALLKSAPEVATTARDSHLLHDLLWAHATPDDGIQHIVIRPAPQGMEAVLFLTAPCDEAALRQVRQVFLRAREPFATHGFTASLPA